jgi:hypothetical protein
MANSPCDRRLRQASGHGRQRCVRMDAAPVPMLVDAPVRVMSGIEATFGRARGVDLDGAARRRRRKLRRLASGGVSLCGTR